MASLDVAVQHDRVLARPWTQDWLGMIPAPAASAPVVARGALEVDGTIPAATARCRLAVEGGTTARASVEAELRGEDRALEHVARACPLGDERALDLADARLFLDGLLGQLEQGLMPEGRMAIGALGALRDAGDEAATDYAARLLADARPQDDYQTVLFAAQDHLLEHAEDRLVAWLGDALGGEDPDEIEIALVLMRRKPIGAYVDLIERGLEQRGDDEVRDALRRLLVWVMSGAPDVSDDKRDAFATRLATWIDAMPQPRAAVLAPALLDLGAAGHAAYAEGLRGSRRVDYVQGLGHVRRIIPAVVAAALLEPVDASTPAQERQAVWIAAYRTAPAEAADALRAAGERVDPGDREEMRDVLEVVRHRAVKAAR